MNEFSQDPRQKRLTDEAKTMSKSELYRALSWQESLVEHFDEIGASNEYGKSAVKIEAIKAELRRRGE